MYYPALRLDPSQIWTSYKYPPSESHGFEPALLQQFCSEEIDVEGEDDTWFEGGLARVFDPYYDLEAADVRSVDGRTDNRSGLPVGKCTVVLQGWSF